VLIACGARAGELADNAFALRLFRALAREGQLLELRLEPLDPTNTAELAASVAAGLDSARIFSESGGNPLFALEVARALSAGEATLSHSLEGLIVDRLAQIDERASELIPWAAAYGCAVSLDLLAEATGIAPANIFFAVGELERHGIVRAVEGERSGPAYDFAHDLFRRAAYHQLSEPRRRWVHLQWARALGRRPDAQVAAAADLQHHATLGGDFVLAMSACVAAGNRCLAIFAHEEAYEVVARGKALLRHFAPAERIRHHLALVEIELFARGETRSTPQRRAAQEAELSRLTVEAESRGLPAEVSRGFMLLSTVHYFAGDIARASDESLRAAAIDRTADPATLARELSNAARCLLQIESDIERARTVLEEACAVATRNRIEFADLPLGLGMLAHWNDDLDAATAHLSRALELTRAEKDRWRQLCSLLWLSMVDLERGRPAEMLARWPELESLVQKAGEGSELPFAHAMAAVARAQLDSSAGADLEAALAALAAADSRGQLSYVLNLAARHQLARGDHRGAESYARAALGHAEAVKRNSQRLVARALLAEVALGDGDTSTARAVIEPALTLASALGFQIPKGAYRSLCNVAQQLNISIPTQAPTVAPTTPH
jgi:hypothetical protein